jgi:hypothetical protein
LDVARWTRISLLDCDSAAVAVKADATAIKRRIQFFFIA